MLGAGLAMAGLTEFGCGGGGGSGTMSAGGATASSSHSSSAGHTVSASSSSSSGGTAGGGTGGGTTGNHTIGMATMLTVNTATMGMLVDYKTPDFYSFTAKAGERLVIQVIPPNLTGFTDPTLIDPAIALIDSSMNLMAPLTYQNGSNPYAGQVTTLYVQIPADGTYYLQLIDCNAFFKSGCPNNPTMITDTTYNIVVADTSKLQPAEVVAAMTQNGMTANADTVPYMAGKTAGTYVASYIGGDWKSATDTHVFKFTPPAAATVMTGGRGRAEFYFQQIGGAMTQGGDLSDANAKVWITDDAAGMHIIAAANQSNYGQMTIPLDLSIPYTSGTTYYLFAQNTQTMGGPTKDFYFSVHELNPLFDNAEKEVFGMHTNDTGATAEVLPALGSAHTLFAIDGDISAPGSATTPDLDWFALTVPNSITQYGYQCDSARSGSGLGSFKIELFQADMTTAIGAPGVESAMQDLYLNPVALPAGVTAGAKMFVKLSAATQDTMDTGTQYRCFVFFQ
jgi:hypothetical protein